MTSRDFVYWFQGFLEISGETLETIEKPQLDQIRKHLNLVFVHEIDPSYGGPVEQDKLNAIHTPPKPVAPFTNKPRPNGPGGPVARC